MSSRCESSSYDAAILGGGSAGYAAARTAAAAGLRTVVIEGGPEVGGLCILRGCMPSKALLYAAEVLHLAREGKTWGLRIPRAGFDFTGVMARKRAMVEDFAGCRRQQLNAGAFCLFAGARAFRGPAHPGIKPERAETAVVERKAFHHLHRIGAGPGAVSGPGRDRFPDQ